MDDFMFELKRKAVHMLTVVYIEIYYLVYRFFSQRTALLALIFILICLAFLEFLQMRYNRKIPFFNRFYRKNEKSAMSGNIYLLIGMIISFAVFDFNIALVAVLMMIFGDTASAIIGRLGKHKIAHLGVSWEGIISEFTVDIAIGSILLNSIPVVLIMALSATIVETALDSIDDNLAVPVVAGFAGQALAQILGHLNVL